MPGKAGSVGRSPLTAMVYGCFSEAVRQCVFGPALEVLVDPYGLGFHNQIQIYKYMLTYFVVPRPSLLTTAFYK